MVRVLVVRIERHRRAEVAHVGAVVEIFTEDVLAEPFGLIIFVEVVLIGVDLLQTVFEQLFARVLLALFLDVSDIDAVAVVVELVAEIAFQPYVRDDGLLGLRVDSRAIRTRKRVAVRIRIDRVVKEHDLGAVRDGFGGFCHFRNPPQFHRCRPFLRYPTRGDRSCRT